MMYLEIVFSRDFDPAIIANPNCKRRGNTITARGTKDEMLAIIRAVDSVTCDKTIILREAKDESEKETQS